MPNPILYCIARRWRDTSHKRKARSNVAIPSLQVSRDMKSIVAGHLSHHVCLNTSAVKKLNLILMAAFTRDLISFPLVYWKGSPTLQSFAAACQVQDSHVFTLM